VALVLSTPSWGATGLGFGDRGNGSDDAGVFHGRLGLNARHITLVAVGAGYVQRSIREMNACSSLPSLPPAGRSNVTKGAVIVRSDRSEPAFFSFAAWCRQTNADSSRHDHSESLKNPLHAAQ